MLLKWIDLQLLGLSQLEVDDVFETDLLELKRSRFRVLAVLEHGVIVVALDLPWYEQHLKQLEARYCDKVDDFARTGERPAVRMPGDFVEEDAEPEPSPRRFAGMSR